MRKFIASMVYTLLILYILTPSGWGIDQKKQSAQPLKSEPGPSEDVKMPLSFKNVIGNWSLQYSGNYGYYFSLSKNYRAIVIIYLNTQSLIFKGVYTIDEKNKLKINISELKDEPRITGINLYTGYIKAKSSYFIFDGYKIRKNNKDSLYLEPRSIIIDGNNSEGYFEPSLKLTKASR
jgi:hypothetical protein